jgi:hypothetical protein
MVWRFRKSFSPLPGVRITLSPSGVSTSVGFGLLRVGVGPRGAGLTARVPGTGLSFHQPLGGVSPRAATPRPLVPALSGEDQAPLPSVPVAVPPSVPEMDSIQSAGSGALTTAGLSEYKRLLEQARHEHGEVQRELAQARLDESRKVGQYTRWKNGLILRHLLKSRFEQHRLAAEESSAKRSELEEQERQSRLQTQIELPDRVVHVYSRLCDEFAALAKCDRIWDTVSHRSANRSVERTTATRIVERKAVRFQLGQCELIESTWKVPHLENANGGDIYFYPAFVLYFISADRFALLEYKEIKLTALPTQFHEEETLLRDTKVVGHTWAKANKDGSPDKRFKDNYQIPVALYGKIEVQSSTGMNEEYLFSNANTAERFALAWQEMVRAVAAGV